MSTRNENQRRHRLVTGIRAATIVVVVGTLAAVWHPTHSIDPSSVPAMAPSAAARADMSVYFPDRFPAPQGPIEALPPQF
jgi:hypothetical protein